MARIVRGRGISRLASWSGWVGTLSIGWLLTGCSEQEDTADVGLSRQASKCGGTWNLQHVESYDGTLGVSESFVDLHERPVGLHLQSNMPNCTGTLISRNLFLSAGHCSYAVNETVRFNYQRDGN